ncbi:uncharacterized protein [Sagmatias obliquidens]|uniref:uncharacterized protein n=1 Tax=Sagmatias obliquidens TaxID=3371155 RepID=UPI000F443B56|nr:uncharacterized protein LOC113627384 [Lagenorhynchus obliquidens]
MRGNAFSDQDASYERNGNNSHSHRKPKRTKRSHNTEKQNDLSSRSSFNRMPPTCSCYSVQDPVPFHQPISFNTTWSHTAGSISHACTYQPASPCATRAHQACICNTCWKSFGRNNFKPQRGLTFQVSSLLIHKRHFATHLIRWLSPFMDQRGRANPIILVIPRKQSLNEGDWMSSSWVLRLLCRNYTACSSGMTVLASALLGM